MAAKMLAKIVCGPKGARTSLILIVDDDRAVVQLVRTVLENSGYEVQEAAGGQQALNKLRAASAAPQLMLTDILMPDVSGLLLAAQVHRLLPALPVIFMSGFAEDYQEELTGSVCLRKPFTVGHLLSAVDDVLTAPPRVARASPSGSAD